MNTIVDICIIEDDGAQRDLLARRLSGQGHSVVHCGSGAEGLRLILLHHPKIVLCDVVLPDIDGIEVCRRARSDPALDGVYFVLLSANTSNELKQQGLASGCDDYLTKPCRMEEVAARVRTGLRLYRLQERLSRAALVDGLTQVWNHSHFRCLLDREFSRVRRYGGVLSLLMLDLDYFKAVNDTYGHENGNEVLRLTASYLAGAVRETDHVARYGGEEFAVICPETDLAEATRLAERLRTGLSRVVTLPAHPELLMRSSHGVACSAHPTVATPSDLIDVCDRALYQSKRLGRNRVTRCDQIDDSMLENVPLEEVERLRKEVFTLGIRSKELCLQSIWALIQALDTRDRYSAWHSRNVRDYTQWLAEAAGWSNTMQTAVTNAAMLHDLGKIGLPDELLIKPKPLDTDEISMLREVPSTTCRILEPLRVFETEIEIIRHLRESYDGSGYPDGLAGENIPIGSRLLAIAEAFDSMTCNRAWRPGRTLDEAVAEIQASGGRQFDPQFVHLLERVVSAQRTRWQTHINRARIELHDVQRGGRVG